jgi:hypothetical protein
VDEEYVGHAEHVEDEQDAEVVVRQDHMVDMAQAVSEIAAVAFDHIQAVVHSFHYSVDSYY